MPVLKAVAVIAVMVSLGNVAQHTSLEMTS